MGTQETLAKDEEARSGPEFDRNQERRRSGHGGLSEYVEGTATSLYHQPIVSQYGKRVYFLNFSKSSLLLFTGGHRLLFIRLSRALQQQRR